MFEGLAEVLALFGGVKMILLILGAGAAVWVLVEVIRALGQRRRNAICPKCKAKSS